MNKQRINDLLSQVQHRLVRVDPRRPFRETGIERDEALFVRAGILALCKIDGRGRQIVALRFPDECVLPGGGATYAIEALVPSEVAVVPDFGTLVTRNAVLSAAFWRAAQRDAAIAHEWLVNKSKDCTSRVAHLLCELSVRSGWAYSDADTMRLPFSQTQIAEITGQTNVNVNRVMAELERQGLIERDKREIRFRDWQELCRVARFQEAYLKDAA